MLSAGDVTTTVRLLHDHEHGMLRTLPPRLHQALLATELLPAGHALAHLLAHGLLTHPSHRLSALFLIAHTLHTRPSHWPSHPFLRFWLTRIRFLLESLESHTSHPSYPSYPSIPSHPSTSSIPSHPSSIPSHPSHSSSIPSHPSTSSHPSHPSYPSTSSFSSLSSLSSLASSIPSHPSTSSYPSTSSISSLSSLASSLHHDTFASHDSAPLPLSACIPELNIMMMLMHPLEAEKVGRLSPAAFLEKYSKEIVDVPVDFKKIVEEARAFHPALTLESQSNGDVFSFLSPFVVHTFDSLIPAPDPASPNSGRLGDLHDYLSPCGLQLQFLKTPPPLMPPDDDEITWLEDEPTFKLLWDPTMDGDSTPKEEFRRLLTKAFQVTLEQPQLKFMIDQMNLDVDFVMSNRFEAHKLSGLVENNSQLAVEMLLRLAPLTDITEYFLELVKMEISLHSIDVVNRLSTQGVLPNEFIVQYVEHCVSGCRSARDRFAQHRLVRLVSVFLQSLIRNKCVNVQDVQLTLQPFCIEYVKIKESSDLYRLLGSLPTQ
eukprot:TRINITY_DN2107_c0_g1_i1.p1 TRINITY_DN2107_c0_g1~~TRINITY_DN2107_c0_g1_i1.p1  ORF type:complete len:544 (+),score=111.37 TRINITY_DN2107_c0_g1_i1:168-1799(+)